MNKRMYVCLVHRCGIRQAFVMNSEPRQSAFGKRLGVGESSADPILFMKQRKELTVSETAGVTILMKPPTPVHTSDRWLQADETMKEIRMRI